MPRGTYILYPKSPKGAGELTFANASEAGQFLIKELSISTVPWDDCGAFTRFSVTYEARDEAAEEEAGPQDPDGCDPHEHRPRRRFARSRRDSSEHEGKAKGKA